MFEFLFYATLIALDSNDDDNYETSSGYGALGNDYDGYYDECDYGDCADCGGW